MPDRPPDTIHDAYFEDLLVRYLDNQLSPAELTEFQAMLAADPAVRTVGRVGPSGHTDSRDSPGLSDGIP